MELKQSMIVCGKDWMNFLKEYKTVKGVMDGMITSGLAENYIEARNALNMYIPKEKYFQDKIIDYLKGLYLSAVWKAQAGFYSTGGIPDVCCVYKGQFYGFEVKRPFIGEISPLQREMAERIIAAGGRVEFVSWVADVKKVIDP